MVRSAHALLLLLFPLLLMAQQGIYLHLSDGTLVGYPLGQVDSITYGAWTEPTAVLNPTLTYGTLTDVEGNIYATIEIGDQEWMAENLRTTSYANGAPILHVEDGDTWVGLSQQEAGAWANYANQPGNDAIYGKLYNWYAVNDPQGLCPTDWRVPTNADRAQLLDYLGGDALAGGMLKSAGTQYWAYPNLAGTNASGYSALPAGYRAAEGGFAQLLGHTYFWTANFSNASNAWHYHLSFDGAGVGQVSGSKRMGLSVRCVRE